jgi:glycosyltransferase involved in cell wall biosynthesis
MPAYNCAKFIRQSIDSVLNQTYTNIELLIADDCSTDDTRSVIDSYTDPRIKRHHNTQNSGYLKTCNKLLALAQGQYLAFQDADDYTAPARFATQIEVLLKDNTIDVCGCNLLYVDEDDNQLYCSHFVKGNDDIRATMLNREFPYSPNTYVFKREVFETLGGYNEYFNRIGAEDYYWTSLIVEKYRILNIPQAYYYYRFNPNSISGDLSDNPKKLYSSEIVRHLYAQRVATGTDDLEQGHVDKVEEFLSAHVKQYQKDKAAFLHRLAIRSYYYGNKKQGIDYLIRAIKKNPLRISYYKDLLYFYKNSKQ